MWSLPRSPLAGIAVSLLLLGCGARQGEETGAVSADVTKQLQDLLLARASAMATGNREVFVQTIDQTRPALRRSQLREFDYPGSHGGLTSTFKIVSVERYRGYLRAWVEERLSGNAFPDAFPQERAYARRYFRSEGGKWLITEPTAEEAGAAIARNGKDVDLTYWAMDEDIADVLLSAIEEARGFALRILPGTTTAVFGVTFIPTAVIAGPGWDAFIAFDGPPRVKVYPQWYGIDETRRQVPDSVRMALRSFALEQLRYAHVPGLSPARLSRDQWLGTGWDLYNTGVDVTATLRHTCVGVPALTLEQLSSGPPVLGDPGVAPDTYGRYYGFATSMAGYLLERFGADGYWRLMDAFAKNASGAENFLAVFGITREVFYRDWLTSVKKKYC